MRPVLWFSGHRLTRTLSARTATGPMALQFNNVIRGAIPPEEAVVTLQSKLQQIIEEGR
jgi:hypothetical protein